MSNDIPTREFMKSDFGAIPAGWQSDQDQGKAYPPLQKAPAEGAKLINLPKMDDGVNLTTRDIFEVMAGRRSRRRFAEQPITLEELTFMLWASAGVQRVVGDGYCTMRIVPSAGARHPFETYLVVRDVEGLDSGLYHYLPLSHQLEFCREIEDLPARLKDACMHQGIAAKAAVSFVWCCVPYRTEWRYGPGSYKPMLIDAGHVGQNLYLAAEALNASCCAIGAYDQAKLDALLGLDGQDEFAVYLAAVGARK